MGGEKAEACITDSPYGINQDGITNDEPEKLRVLFDGVLKAIPIDNGVIINFQSPRLFPVWLDAIRDNGHAFQRMLWMYKSNDVSFVWRGWLTKSECILVSTIGNPSWNTPSEYNHDCYSINWDKTTMVDVEGWHASIKPPLIVKSLVDNTCGIVYEPFAGSGTTAIACEQLARQCRMIEIEPKYCAVILQRMTDMGLEPRKIEQ
jgi:DNA modification methylase